MSFDKLQSIILAEAKEEAAKISRDLGQQKSSHEERIKNLASSIEEKIITGAEEKAMHQERHLHQEAELIARAHVLRAKQQELDVTQAEFTKHILSLETKETEQILEALFSSLPSKEKGEVFAGSLHADSVKKLAKKHGFEVAKKEVTGDGGFMFRTKESEINYTVSHLIKQIFLRNRTQLAKALFS